MRGGGGEGGGGGVGGGGLGTHWRPVQELSIYSSEVRGGVGVRGPPPPPHARPLLPLHSAQTSHPHCPPLRPDTKCVPCPLAAVSPPTPPPSPPTVAVR